MQKKLRSSAAKIGANGRVTLGTVAAVGARPVLFPFSFAPDSACETVPPIPRHAQATFGSARTAQAKNFREVRQISGRSGVPHAELDPQTIPADAFLDHGHLKKEGEHVKAEFMAGVILDLVEKQKDTPAAKPALGPLPVRTTRPQ